MQEIRHRVVMLRAMLAGASGFARVECEHGKTMLQVNMRGLKPSGAQVFWYAGGGEAIRLGSAKTNAHGEALLTAEAPATDLAPKRLQALLVISDESKPAPLLIGLCAQQSAGSLMDAKNAALALCEKLTRQNAQAARSKATAENAAATVTAPQAVTEGMQTNAHASLPQAATDRAAAVTRETLRAPIASPSLAEPLHGGRSGASAVSAAPTWAASAEGAPHRPPRPEVPREIFLPAIDPLPYVQALRTREPQEAQPPHDGQEAQPPRDMQEAPPQHGVQKALPSAAAAKTAQSSAPLSFAPEDALALPCETPCAPRMSAPPADRLRPLQWPRGFESLAPYFERGMPCRLFPWAGWRFVHAAQGLWLGYSAADGRVQSVAYAYLGSAPKPLQKSCRPALSVSGESFQVLRQRV